MNFIFITSWNEWNEQSSLEPNNHDGYNYLNQIKLKYNDYFKFKKDKNVLIFCHKGGGTEIINVFFENNIFYRNHWPKDVLIQPKNNIILTENDLKKQFSGSNSYISNLEQNLKEHMIFDINRFDASYIFDVLGFEKIKISKIKEDQKGLWQGF